MVSANIFNKIDRFFTALPKLAAILFVLTMPFVYAQTPANGGGGSTSSANVTSVQKTFCSLISLISEIIEILAIFMFALGAILYGSATLLPAAGNFKGSMQGWGMGMIIGGVIAIILYLLSGFIITKIASFGGAGVVPSIAQVNCNSLM